MAPLTGPTTGDRTIDIGRLAINDITFEATVERIIASARDRAGGYVVTPNVDYVVRSNTDVAFRAAINGGTLRVPDGMWIVYASRIAGTPLTGTVTGRLLLPVVAQRAAAEGIPIALYGAGPGGRGRPRPVGQAVPGPAGVAAITPPPNLQVGSPEDLAAIDRLLEHPFGLLFVALGAPKQELWMQARYLEVRGRRRRRCRRSIRHRVWSVPCRPSVDDKMGPGVARTLGAGTPATQPAILDRRPMDPLVGGSSAICRTGLNVSSIKRIDTFRSTDGSSTSACAVHMAQDS